MVLRLTLPAKMHFRPHIFSDFVVCVLERMSLGTEQNMSRFFQNPSSVVRDTINLP